MHLKVNWGPGLSEHLYTFINPPSEKHLAKACEILRQDGVIAYSTGINWAFGCDATSAKALDRILRLNPTHPKDRPFSLICSDITMASTVGSIDHQLYRILKRVWPGHYTVIVKRHKTLPRQLKDKRPVVGIRIPDAPLMLALIEKYGSPLATTSVPVRPDGSPFQMGWEIFEVYGHGIDLLLDLGEQVPGLDSTIVDFSEGYPEIVRVGAGDPSFFS